MFYLHELCGEGKRSKKSCTRLQIRSKLNVKFPIRTGPAWEEQSKPSYSERLVGSREIDERVDIHGVPRLYYTKKTYLKCKG